MRWQHPDPHVSIVAWSGPVSALAVRLNAPQAELLSRLKALAHDRQGSSRLVVAATPANAGPILAALARRLNEGEAA